MCSTHFTLSCRILIFSPPHRQQLFHVCVFWNHRNLTHFDSGLLISRPFLPHAGSSCTLLCLYLVSSTQKMHWRAHSLADIIPPFLTILRFSLELSNNWGTGLPCLCHLWIYCTGQQHKASLFLWLFSCLSSLCLQLLHHGLYLSFAQVLSFLTCTITSPLLRNPDFPFFKRLPSPSRSHGMPLLALIVQQTLTFLSDNVWASLTFIKIVLIDVRKNGWWNCWVSGPLEDRNCLCELVVGTSLSLSKLSLSL